MDFNLAEQSGTLRDLTIFESWPHHADDFVALTIQRDAPSNHARITGELLLPESVGEYDRFGCMGRSSAALNVRPSTALAPQSRKKCPLTCIPAICCGMV